MIVFLNILKKVFGFLKYFPELKVRLFKISLYLSLFINIGILDFVFLITNKGYVKKAMYCIHIKHILRLSNLTAAYTNLVNPELPVF